MSVAYLSHNNRFVIEKFLDESLPLWYTESTEQEQSMFNPLEILDKQFTVTFVKQDGTLRELTGYLFEKEKFASDYGYEYCVGLVDKNLIPIITDKGWRSFIVSSVIKVEIN
jgi:uncharacterized protein involved in type VI secretion and phage assembly